MTPGPLRIGAKLLPVNVEWADLERFVVRLDRAGFDSIWLPDHLAAAGRPVDAVFDGWTTLAAVAPVTARATLGLLVGAVTFREPALVAKMAVTLDHASHGRAVVGLGAAWNEAEHAANGIKFPATFGERLDRLDEALTIIRRLLDGDQFSFAGRHYALHDAYQAPRPIQLKLPLLIGGSGRQKTLRLVARHADLWHSSVDRRLGDLLAADSALETHCATESRDPATVERLHSKWIAIASDAASAAERLDAGARLHGLSPEHDQSRQDGIRMVGTPAAIAAQLAPFAAAGFRHVIVPFRAPFDVETVERMAEVRELLGAAVAELRV